MPVKFEVQIINNFKYVPNLVFENWNANLTGILELTGNPKVITQPFI